MKCIEPDYAAQFHCLAGACPDTCCKDWEIILDKDAIARYRALPGAFGDEVRASLTTDAEGDTMFRLLDGHCPLVREDGLCRVQLALGEAGLCNTCRTHPRFIEEYGATRELSLSISCPAAARLLLEHPAPVTFFSREDGAPVEGCNDLDPELYLSLRAARQTAFSIAQNRALPIADRLSLLLLFAVRLQKLLDGKHYGRLDPLLERFSSESGCRRQLARARRLQSKKSSFFPCWLILNNMEHLTARFAKLLDSMMQVQTPGGFDGACSSQWENLTVYFLYRYFLKACVDGDVLTQTACCVFHVLSIASMFSCAHERTPQTLCTLAGLYSKEVEHSEENLLLLRRVFSRQTLRWQTLVSLLGARD